MMASHHQPAVHRLSNELWNAILKEIEPDTNKTIAVDDRRFLSVESFDAPPVEISNSVANICKFRQLGKKFAILGAPFLFTRVTARFSEKGLVRLEQLAEWPHLACHVRKFSYLVPYFFTEGTADFDRIAHHLHESDLSTSNLESLKRKWIEQKRICSSQRDVKILQKAISSFTGLQFVQLLRVTDDEDRIALSFLQRHESVTQAVNLDWTAACLHASRSIGIALLQSSNAEWSRFSSPMLSPSSAQFLRITQPESLSTLAERLTCLTLHFDDGENLDAKMRDLSDCFRIIFSTAKNMQVVHLGFPIHRPLTLPLEDIFHHVKWEKLHAFGVQAWELHADEIIALVRRHRNLKGLRLRDVYLKEGSMWKDVLPVLRNELLRLEWISLRRVGYAPFQLGDGMGAEIPDYPFSAMLDSDSSDGDDEEPRSPITTRAASSDDGASSEEDEDHDSQSDVEEDIRLDFPELDATEPAQQPSWCDCGGRDTFSDSVEDLGDTGVRPDNVLRKKWEKWVLRRCPEHGS